MKLDTQLLPMMMMMRFDEVISFQQFFLFLCSLFHETSFFTLLENELLIHCRIRWQKKDVCIRHVINDILYHIETLSLR